MEIYMFFKLFPTKATRVVNVYYFCALVKQMIPPNEAKL